MHYGSRGLVTAVSTAAVWNERLVPGSALKSGKPPLLLDLCWDKAPWQSFEAAQFWLEFFRRVFSQKKKKVLMPFVFQRQEYETSLAKEHLFLLNKPHWGKSPNFLWRVLRVVLGISVLCRRCFFSGGKGLLQYLLLWLVIWFWKFSSIFRLWHVEKNKD